MWRSLARRVGAAAVLGACGGPTRPDFAPDLEQTEPPDDSLIDPGPAPPPSYSPCGAATVELEFVRPNLYFALDASGSMLEGIPNTQDPSVPPEQRFLSYRYAVLATAVERLLERVGHRVSYGATLFPTADVTCDAGEEILALTPGDEVSFAVSGETGPVLAGLMRGIRRRLPRGGTPVADALRSILPTLTGRSDSYVFLITDGGPNCGTPEGCGPETCIPNIERQLISEAERCEAPLNCCDGSLFGPESCLDSAGSKSAVDRLAEAGVRTFVVGMPGSEVYAGVLDQLAESGGMARADSPKYYRVRDADQLVETVSRLGRQVALGCSIELAEPPPDAGFVNVYFDGTLVPADTVDGWRFSNETTIELIGEACRLLSTGEVLQADIVAGCPIVVR